MVEFNVLRCAHCETFQVLQVSKSKNWKCKLCGEKQSILKEYGRGTGADCRRHVQKLNSLRGEIEATSESMRLNSVYELDKSLTTIETPQPENVIKQVHSSKWSDFMTEAADGKLNGEAIIDKDNDRDPTGNQQNKGEICYTTDRSVFQNERQASKRKKGGYGQRSKWNKSRRCEESSPMSDGDCSDAEYTKDRHKNNRFKSCQDSDPSTDNTNYSLNLNRNDSNNNQFTTSQGTARHCVNLDSPVISCSSWENDKQSGLNSNIHGYDMGNDERPLNSNKSLKAKVNKIPVPVQSSKWSSYLTAPKDSDSDDNSEYIMMPEQDLVNGKDLQVKTSDNCSFLLLPYSSIPEKNSTFTSPSFKTCSTMPSYGMERFREKKDSDCKEEIGAGLNKKTVQYVDNGGFYGNNDIISQSPPLQNKTGSLSVSSLDNGIGGSSLFQLDDMDENFDLEF